MIITTLACMGALILNQPVINRGLTATIGQTIELPQSGGFDYMAFDAKHDRVLASHTGAKTLAVFSLGSNKVQELATGQVNGLEVVPQWNRIFAGGGGNVLCSIDESSLKILKSVPLQGDGDALAVDTQDKLIFQCHDDHPEIWVFGADNLDLKGTVPIDGIPEYIVYAKSNGMIYQNIKDKNLIDEIDPKQMKVVKSWSTGDLETPSGLVYDASLNLLVCCGRNGIAKAYDLNGKLVGTSTIAPSIDQSTLDPSWHLVLSAGRGHLTGSWLSRSGLKPAMTIDIEKGAHTLTVDPKTHTVWISFSKSGKAYLQSIKLSLVK